MRQLERGRARDPAIDEDLLALEEDLEKLERRDPRKAQLVKLRFFAGLTIEQAARVLDVSTSTADNDWAYARAWLRCTEYARCCLHRQELKVRPSQLD
jgi:DNA-directed RNA polymerase specialized sigma24 family protein